MINRKGKFDAGIKSCNRCKLDYTEKENYNWSCRVHKSMWGGEMYWCCGKTSKDAPGCLVTKHEAGDGDDDDVKGKEDTQNKANQKCGCCRGLGCDISNCKRDPNLKRSEDPTEEIDRISKIKDFRKLHADTQVQTTQLLKKLVMMPIKYDECGE